MARNTLRARSEAVPGADGAGKGPKPLASGQAKRTQITPEEVARLRDAVARVVRQSKGLAVDSGVRQRLVDAMGAIEVALLASDGIFDALNEGRELAREAAKEPLKAKRLALADKYDGLRARIDTIAKDATREDINLVAGGKEFVEVVADRTGRARLALRPVNLTARGLNFRTAVGGFEDPEEAQTALKNISEARARVRRGVDALVAAAGLLAERLSPA